MDLESGLYRVTVNKYLQIMDKMLIQIVESFHFKEYLFTCGDVFLEFRQKGREHRARQCTCGFSDP